MDIRGNSKAQQEREEVKRLLMEQLNRLSMASENIDRDDLAQCSNAMVEIAYCMDDMFY